MMVVLAATLVGFGALAQDADKSVQEKRAEQRELGIREGETLEYCGTHWKMQEMFEKHPSMRLLYEKKQEALERDYQEYIENKESHPEAKAGTVYTIPVVFHILHQNGIENISYDQVLDAVAILNRDFRLQNTDAGSVVAGFSGVPADAEIEFALATKAPNGDCFNGITRTESPLTFDGSSGFDQVQEIVDHNDVYQGLWPGDEYLNIFVAADIGGAAGYTFNPSGGSLGTSMANGIWIQHTYVGSIETASIFRSRSLTHEVGHWLNLSHPWGGNNNPGVSCGTDGVADTPQTMGWTSCNLSGTTCDGNLDNVENYMEYSYCSKMFTPGQVDRMRIAITSSTGGRNNLWTTSNLNATGANGPLTLCKANFAADELVICEGDVVNFIDDSYHNVTGWNWSFAGGSPSSSTVQNPSITYNTEGTYAVTLQASDGSSTVTETKTAYITVLPAVGRLAPIQEGFESISSIPTTDWFVENPDGSFGWAITTAAAATGSKSIRVLNNGSNAGNKDEFVSNTIDLSSVSTVTLSFKYAFAKRNTSNSDILQVWASSDCGATWSLRKNISSASLPTAPVQGGSFTPTASQWTTVDITNLTSVFWTSNFRFKITFTSGGGNNIYVDDINIDTSTDIDDLNSISQFNVYPNPTTDVANIEFQLNQPQDVEIQIMDVVGKLVSSEMHSGLASGEQRLSIDVGTFPQGMYLIRMVAGNSELTRRLMVE